MPFDEYYSSTHGAMNRCALGGLRIWHSAGDYPYSAAGTAYLSSSPAATRLTWQKVPFQNEDGRPEVFIPNGKEGDCEARNDGGYMSEFQQCAIRIGDELIYYYGSSSWGKKPTSALSGDRWGISGRG